MKFQYQSEFFTDGRIHFFWPAVDIQQAQGNSLCLRELWLCLHVHDCEIRLEKVEVASINEEKYYKISVKTKKQKKPINVHRHTEDLKFLIAELLQVPRSQGKQLHFGAWERWLHKEEMPFYYLQHLSVDKVVGFIFVTHRASSSNCEVLCSPRSCCFVASILKHSGVLWFQQCWAVSSWFPMSLKHFFEQPSYLIDFCIGIEHRNDLIF